MKHDLARITSHFRMHGDFLRAELYGSGHINDTYAVWCDQGGTVVRYIVQRINHHIFRDPPSLMDTIGRTVRHLRAKLTGKDAETASRRVLTLIPTIDDADFFQDGDGCYWRAYIFIEHARTYDVIQDTGQAREAAWAFGRFQHLLSDLPPPRLVETIIGFHNTRSRFDAFIRALETDAVGRADSAAEEIEFARNNESMVDVLLDLQSAGELPERITHNDTKLNNVMIDDNTGEGICVIDLDTVMPGLTLYDFGDMVRTATNTGAEDERDLSRVSSDPEMFAALADGYLASASTFLNEREIELLPFSGQLITFEIGLRFLTDYLSGDAYFKTHRTGHNLDRCRTQFKLARSIAEQEAAMRSAVDSARMKYRT